jgi:hypothetical protein
LAWSRAGGWQPTSGAFIRLALFQPGFQLILSVRLQELIRTIPFVGRTTSRILWYFSTLWFGAEISAVDLPPNSARM